MKQFRWTTHAGHVLGPFPLAKTLPKETFGYGVLAELEINETWSDCDGSWLRLPDALTPETRCAGERLERIATAALQGLSDPSCHKLPKDRIAYWSVSYARALIAELDKPA